MKDRANRITGCLLALIGAIAIWAVVVAGLVVVWRWLF